MPSSTDGKMWIFRVSVTRSSHGSQWSTGILAALDATGLGYESMLTPFIPF